MRSFWLAMPVPPGAPGGQIASAARPARIRIEAPYRSFVPRLLDERGLGGYEPETMAAFLAAIGHLGAAEAFDIGANIGVFSIVAASVTSAHITGFEPTPDLAATYRAIAAANRLSCDVEQLALGAEEGTARLYLSALTDSSNSLAAGYRATAGTVEVDVERLDHYVERTGRRPLVMKIDTESTEPSVLAGASALLRDLHPWILCEVLAGRTEEGLMAQLRPVGYRFHRLVDGGRPVETDRIVGDPTYRQRDWLFTPGALPPSFLDDYEAWRAAIGSIDRR
jgi:FkbM family methyltransferase